MQFEFLHVSVQPLDIGIKHDFLCINICLALREVLKTIWWMNDVLGIMAQCDTKIDLINYMKVSDLYFMVQWFCPISWKLFDGWRPYLDEGHTWDNELVWHKDWPHKIYIGQWPIFHSPVILLNILKTIRWRNVILGIMDQNDTEIDLMKYIWIVSFILWSSDFVLYLQDYLMVKCLTSDYQSVWHYVWFHKYM